MNDKETIEFLKEQNESCLDLLRCSIDNAKYANNVNNKTNRVAIIAAFTAITIIVIGAIYFYFNQETSFDINNTAESITHTKE